VSYSSKFIRSAQTVKFLCFYLDEFLHWDAHIEFLTKKTGLFSRHIIQNSKYDNGGSQTCNLFWASSVKPFVYEYYLGYSDLISSKATRSNQRTLSQSYLLSIRP